MNVFNLILFNLIIIMQLLVIVGQFEMKSESKGVRHKLVIPTEAELKNNSLETMHSTNVNFTRIKEF